MEQHPDVGIMSCGFRNFVAQEGDVFYSETNEDIKLNLLYKTQICHAAALIRTDLVAQHTPFYNNDYQHAEDYEFWARMAQYTNYYNLQEVLYHVRVLKTSVSRVFADVQHNNTLRVIKFLFSRFGISITDAELDLWLKFCYADFVFTPAELKVLEGLLVGLVNTNPAINYVNQSALEQFLAFKWFNLCYNNVKNKEVQKIFNSSQISALAPLPNRLKFKVKAVLG
jgi:hypothetical protein